MTRRSLIAQTSMETNAYNYREAQRTIEKTQTISPADAIAIANGTDKVSLSLYLADVGEVIAEITASGKYAYNSDIATEITKRLDIADTATVHTRIESIVYGSRRYLYALKTIETYRKYWDAGYISIHDVSEADNGKEALLSGTASVDLWTTKKDDEKVKIVADGTARGYRKPRMRTRFYRPSADADYFVKII